MENSIKSLSGNEIDINSLIKNILSAKEIAHKEQPKQELKFPYIELYGGTKEKISPKHVKLAPIEGNLGEILNRVRCRMKERENNYNYLKSLKFLNQNDSAEKMIEKLSNIDIEKIIIEKSQRKTKKKKSSLSPVSSKKSIENTFDGTLNRPRKIVITDIVDMTKSKPQTKKIINLDSTPSPHSKKQTRYFPRLNSRKSSFIANKDFLSPNNKKSSFAVNTDFLSPISKKSSFISNEDFDNGNKRVFKKRLSSFSPKRNSKASFDKISEDSYSGPKKVELADIIVTSQWKSPKTKDLHYSPNSREKLKNFENSRLST
ncbi:unnamed protein product [Blepharisma stoltei]|uniref:Uncharacterized protein n=1 Tax=Blepharisma stoltei TaxID=1481888 RepID=A0AAU9K1P0_9CILI|nr:unnamed protein product [Blepharisma stoltei]